MADENPNDTIEDFERSADVLWKNEVLPHIIRKHLKTVGTDTWSVRDCRRITAMAWDQFVFPHIVDCDTRDNVTYRVLKFNWTSEELRTLVSMRCRNSAPSTIARRIGRGLSVQEVIIKLSVIRMSVDDGMGCSPEAQELVQTLALLPMTAGEIAETITILLYSTYESLITRSAVVGYARRNGWVLAKAKGRGVLLPKKCSAEEVVGSYGRVSEEEFDRIILEKLQSRR